MDKELLRALSDLMDEKLSPIKYDLNNIKIQQEESISILRSLEHRADVNKAEHDKIINDIAKLSGNVANN